MWQIVARIKFNVLTQDNRTEIRVAEDGLSNPVTLNCSSGVVLDADGYLFIFDSGPNRFQCSVECMNRQSSASDELNYPHSLSFDRDGNMFVADRNNR
jgi:hypothetical protein